MKTEKLGEAIDTVENLAIALNMPIPDAIHVQALRNSLPEVVILLKEGFIETTGENPWE